MNIICFYTLFRVARRMLLPCLSALHTLRLAVVLYSGSESVWNNVL